MNFLFFVFLASSLSTFLYAKRITITPPTGRYGVGVKKLVLNHITVNDPFAPNKTGTSILVTLYYPTLQKSNSAHQYLDPQLAELLETQWLPFPPGSLASLTTTLQYEAPTLPSSEAVVQFPTLVFGPGGSGPPTQCYTTLLSELASRGYTVAALDHPYEQPFLQYPNGGPGIEGLPPSYSGPFDIIYAFRLTDTVVFLDQFPGIVQRSRAPFNTTHYAFLGHSIGGAAAIGSLLQLQNATNPTILGALDLDGTL
jgi:hypothetical protein